MKQFLILGKLLMPDPVGGGGANPKKAPDAPKNLEEALAVIGDLTKANADLLAENKALKSAQVQADADEKLIVQKMAVGLTRDQAKAAIARQRERDKLAEEQKAEREKSRATRAAASKR